MEVRSADLSELTNSRGKAKRGAGTNHHQPSDIKKLDESFVWGVVVRSFRRNADIAEQHGPVRVIMKDGKYVDKETQTK